MELFGLVVHFVLKEGAGDEFDALIRTTLDGVRAHEPGTLLYAVHAVDGEPSQRIFYELYRDADAFAAHEREPHTQHFLGKRADLVASYTVDRVQPITAKGLDVLADQSG